jgi:hypothetical protein
MKNNRIHGPALAFTAAGLTISQIYKDGEAIGNIVKTDLSG